MTEEEPETEAEAGFGDVDVDVDVDVGVNVGAYRCECLSCWLVVAAAPVDDNISNAKKQTKSSVI